MDGSVNNHMENVLIDLIGLIVFWYFYLKESIKLDRNSECKIYWYDNRTLYLTTIKSLFTGKLST